MTAEERRAALARIENVCQLLSIRESGMTFGSLAAFDGYTDGQLAALMASEAATLAVHYQQAGQS